MPFAYHLTYPLFAPSLLSIPPQVWKSYQYVPHEKTRMLSPFEIDVVGSLFRNAGEKFRHKVRPFMGAGWPHTLLLPRRARPSRSYLLPPPPQPTHPLLLSSQVEDNFWDVFPIFAFHVGLVWGANAIRKKMLRDHRD